MAPSVGYPAHARPDLGAGLRRLDPPIIAAETAGAALPAAPAPAAPAVVTVARAAAHAATHAPLGQQRRRTEQQRRPDPGGDAAAQQPDGGVDDRALVDEPAQRAVIVAAPADLGQPVTDNLARTAQLCRTPIPREVFKQVPMSVSRAGEGAVGALRAVSRRTT